ncbi:hypothetical protein LMG27177_02669 [Paraburkholderia fynbosensis]|uniref:Uncharacterized protein n=1 Tax=Paraburkholderia fynbosensis TaxID=1200993 RepID=A0A6J5G4I2_9BURK|nr:hypothetical protein LMG27177_02669 [Paraburkholderia fynbosensis]
MLHGSVGWNGRRQGARVFRSGAMPRERSDVNTDTCHGRRAGYPGGQP